jgi:GR25 family glycosyltransferase involved in LPS biosynthesis
MIDKIFIIHYEPLYERKKYIDSIINNLKIPYEYIISNNETDLNYNINDFYQENYSIWNRKLTIGEICVSINHFNVYQKILNNGYKNCLIIEDDAVFKDNFNIFENILSQLQNVKFDICFLSDCCNLHINEIEENNYIYEANSSRSVCGYIINIKCINKILKTLPFNAPIDWHLNIIKKDLNLIYYWTEPTIIGQGSEYKYESNLRNKIK